MNTCNDYERNHRGGSANGSTLGADYEFDYQHLRLLRPAVLQPVIRLKLWTFVQRYPAVVAAVAGVCLVVLTNFVFQGFLLKAEAAFPTEYTDTHYWQVTPPRLGKATPIAMKLSPAPKVVERSQGKQQDVASAVNFVLVDEVENSHSPNFPSVMDLEQEAEDEAVDAIQNAPHTAQPRTQSTEPVEAAPQKAIVEKSTDKSNEPVVKPHVEMVEETTHPVVEEKPEEKVVVENKVVENPSENATENATPKKIEATAVNAAATKSIQPAANSKSANTANAKVVSTAQPAFQPVKSTTVVASVKTADPEPVAPPIVPTRVLVLPMATQTQNKAFQDISLLMANVFAEQLALKGASSQFGMVDVLYPAESLERITEAGLENAYTRMIRENFHTGGRPSPRTLRALMYAASGEQPVERVCLIEANVDMNNVIQPAGIQQRVKALMTDDLPTSMNYILRARLQVYDVTNPNQLTTIWDFRWHKAVKESGSLNVTRSVYDQEDSYDAFSKAAKTLSQRILTISPMTAFNPRPQSSVAAQLVTRPLPSSGLGREVMVKTTETVKKVADKVADKVTETVSDMRSKKSVQASVTTEESDDAIPLRE